MQIKTFKVRTKSVCRFIEKKAHFGWEMAANSIDRNGITSVSLKRDTSINNYNVLKKLEKQYRRITRFPLVSTIILLALATAFLIPYFFLKNVNYWYLIFVLPAVSLCFVALFNIIIYLMLQVRRKELVKILFEEADIKRGALKNAPYKGNVAKPKDDSFLIKKKIYHNE